MRVYEHNDTEVSFVHNAYTPGDSDHYFISKLGAGHSVGQLALLTELPVEDVLAIVDGDPKVFAKYVLPDFRKQNRYVPLTDNLELYDAIGMRPVKVHDYILEVSL